MRSARRLSWLTACVATFATGMAMSQVGVSIAAFTSDTASGADTWAAASIAPVTGLTANDTCTSSGAPQVVAHSTGAVAGGAVSLTVPAAAMSGDLLLAHLVNDGVSTAAPGFSLLIDTTGTGGNFQGKVYQRLATGSDAGATYSFSVSGAKSSGAMLVVRGASGLASAGEAAGYADGVKTSTVVAPSVTASVADSLLLALYGVKQPTQTFTTPAGMSVAYGYPGPKGSSQAGFAETRAATGATGSRTSTASSANENVGQSVLVRPDASAAAVDLAWTPSTSAFADGYTITRDGTPVASLSDVGTSSWSDPVPLSGSHTYAVRTVVGSWESAPVSVGADVDCAPTVAVTPPAAYVRGTVTVEAIAESTQGVTSVAIQWSPPGAGTWSTVCTDTTAPYSCSALTTSSADGLYDLRAVAVDGGGRTGTSTVVQTTVDNTGPVVTMTDPGATLSGTVTLSATATDALSGVTAAGVTFQIAPWGTTTWTTACTAATAPYSCGYDSSGLATGAYDLRAVATDVAGNTGTSATFAQRQVGTWLTYASTGPVTAVTGNGKVDVMYPADTAQGDLLLLVQVNGDDAGLKPLAGWAVASHQVTGSPAKFGLTVWWRAAGPETSVNVDAQTNGSGASLRVVRYARPAGLPPVTVAHSPVQEGLAAATATLTPAPDVYTTSSSAVVSVAAVRAANALTLSTPAGFGLRTSGANGGGSVPTMFALADLTVTGATTPPSPTWSQAGTAAQWAWTTLAFR